MDRAMGLGCLRGGCSLGEHSSDHVKTLESPGPEAASNRAAFVLR